MTERQTDIVLYIIALIVCFFISIIGGLWYPNTIAGALARFWFSVS